MGRLIIFVGPSGSGKSAMADYMMREHHALKVVSTTNRAVRQGEVEGESYYFVSDDMFTHMTLCNEFVEYAMYSDKYYGTTRAELSEKLKAAGDGYVVNCMEISGALAVKKAIPGTVLIFMDVPISALMKRMHDRGDDFDAITARVQNYVDKKEADNERFCDYVIHNTGSLQDAEEILDRILEYIDYSKS